MKRAVIRVITAQDGWYLVWVAD